MIYFIVIKEKKLDINVVKIIYIKKEIVCVVFVKKIFNNIYFINEVKFNKLGIKSKFCLGKFQCNIEYESRKVCNEMNYVCPGCQSLLFR